MRIPFWSIYSLGATGLIFSFFSYKRGAFFIASLFLVFILGTVSLKNSYYLPKYHISKYITYLNQDAYIIKGFLKTDPEFKNSRVSFIFGVEEIQFNNLRRNACGDILVYIKGKPDLRYGEELILAGKLSRPFGSYANRKSYRHYLANQGIGYIMSVKMCGGLVKLNRNKGFLLKRFSLRLKTKMQDLFFRYTSGLTAGILEAMILGEKKNIPALVYNSMVKSGTVHILVVSGFNVGIVAFIIILLLKLIRMPRHIRFYIILPLLVIYCLLTGASAPVVRATVMAAVFLLAYLIKREPDIYNSLSVAALFILGFNPRQLFDLGFQLSFLSVVGIVFLYPKIKSFLRIDALKIKPVRFLAGNCAVSFSAWLATMGLVAYYFKIFSPITVLANLFIVPLASLITLCGFSLAAIGLVCPALASLFAASCEFFASLLIHLSALLIKIPGAYFYLP